MKLTLKNLRIAALSIPLLVSTGCPEFERGFKRPACIYEDITTEAFVSDFSTENDSITNVVFQTIPEKSGRDNFGSRQVRLNAYEMQNFGLINVEISDTTIRYSLKGKFIIQGTCTPSMISSVQVVEQYFIYIPSWTSQKPLDILIMNTILKMV